jgi:hypothetical protein
MPEESRQLDETLLPGIRVEFSARRGAQQPAGIGGPPADWIAKSQDSVTKAMDLVRQMSVTFTDTLNSFVERPKDGIDPV